MVELIITEKPAAEKKIAEALAEGKPIKEKYKGVTFYRITRGNTDILVGCAVGHLYGLSEIKKKGISYPSFNVEWKAIADVDKKAAFSRKYLDTLKKISKEADSFIVATDYDIEGEVIGWNVLRFACKQKDAKRMKFSTLTKDELIKSYENASPTLDWGQAKAGEARHIMDWYWGINLSRAMTSAIKKAGMFKILSSGRVQGPALKIVVEREKEIKAFKSDPFWVLELEGKVKNGKLSATHETDKFWKKEEADSILKKCKGKDGKVKELKTTEQKKDPPHPFDLTTLQTESYRVFGIQPKVTLSIAQELYTRGEISYPRTSSQEYPESIEYKKILVDLAKITDYKILAADVLKTPLKPNNGKKTDPAHPAIYPTGTKPKFKDEREKKLYDLIVKRFFATFGEPAVRESMNIKIDVENEIFNARGTTTKYEGWHKFYAPYVKLEENLLPAVDDNEPVTNTKITMLDKETQPPKRYTQASLVRELEKRNLGTKATRASVVDTLFERGYVDGKSLEATNLGITTVDVLTKYAPEIIDEDLTRQFEEEMEEIHKNQGEGKAVLDKAEKILTALLKNFKAKEKEIGEGLLDATKETEDKQNTIGPCPKCKEGTLMIKKGKFGRFVACTKYPDCDATHKLPANAMIKATEKTCEHCNHPIVLAIKARRKPQEVCINLDCPAKEVKTDKENTPCEKCKDGKMIMRKSLYGHFLACDKFPKCKNIARL